MSDAKVTDADWAVFPHLHGDDDPPEVAEGCPGCGKYHSVAADCYGEPLDGVKVTDADRAAAEKVVILDIVTRHDIPAERVLNAALEHGLEGVVLAAYDKDGNEYFASSYADGGDTLWLLERCKKSLLEKGDGDADD